MSNEGDDIYTVTHVIASLSNLPLTERKNDTDVLLTLAYAKLKTLLEKM